MVHSEKQFHHLDRRQTHTVLLQFKQPWLDRPSLREDNDPSFSSQSWALYSIWVEPLWSHNCIWWINYPLLLVYSLAQLYAVFFINFQKSHCTGWSFLSITWWVLYSFVCCHLQTDSHVCSNPPWKLPNENTIHSPNPGLVINLCLFLLVLWECGKL